MLRLRDCLPILCCIAAFPVHAGITLNLSHDLVRLGIAGQNLAPNTPTLDAQPLFSAAVQYIQNNPVAVLTADPGAYYFLTSQNDVLYLFLADLSDLTIDFQGSTLYFKNGLLRGFELDYCQRVTLKNFTIDSLVPRNTQVQLTAIDPVQGKLSYTVPPGWADPATFVDTVLGAPQLFAAFFRNGVQLPATALTFITYPVASPTLVVNSLGEPWTQPSVLATLQPGDMAAVGIAAASRRFWLTAATLSRSPISRFMAAEAGLPCRCRAAATPLPTTSVSSRGWAG
jgi:hypothetical protein